MLAANGRLILVGIARPGGLYDLLIEGARVIPAKIGSILHSEKNGGQIGVPTQAPQLTLGEIKLTVKELLQGARIRRGLYYRYLLTWDQV